MANVKVDKLLNYGAVCFIPFAAGDGQTLPFTYQGQTIVAMDASDNLPGFLGYFTPVGSSGMAQPSVEATDPGIGPDEVV